MLYQREITGHNTGEAEGAVDVAAVESLIAQRAGARRIRDYDGADAIRSELYRRHGVRVNDATQTWHLSARKGAADRGNDNNNGGGGGGGNRLRPSRRLDDDFGPNGHDYRYSKEAGPSVSPLSEGEIHAMLAQRLRYKLERNFREADAVQYGLADAKVYVSDVTREWRADGKRFPEQQQQRSTTVGGNGSGGSINYEYTHAAEQDSIGGGNESATTYVKEIQKLVDERRQAKRDREFDRADDIRDDLKRIYDVYINDKSRKWAIGRMPK